MAHIVNCMLEADQDHFSQSQSAIMPGSPVSRSEIVGLAASIQTCSVHLLWVTPKLASNKLLPAPKPLEKPDKAYVWRMYQPERKYQLFPRKEQPQAAPGKGLDPEQAFALAMNQTTNSEKSDKSPPGSGLRLRIKEHNLNRRRKVSVPELGPMTTVQEVPMDSRRFPSATYINSLVRKGLLLGRTNELFA